MTSDCDKHRCEAYTQCLKAAKESEKLNMSLFDKGASGSQFAVCSSSENVSSCKNRSCMFSLLISRVECPIAFSQIKWSDLQSHPVPLWPCPSTEIAIMLPWKSLVLKRYVRCYFIEFTIFIFEGWENWLVPVQSWSFEEPRSSAVYSWNQSNHSYPSKFQTI